MDNIQKVTGTTEPFKLNPGGSISYPFAVRGIVKDTYDIVKTGRIRVYIDDFGATDADNADNWRTVCYLSPFYGVVQNTNVSNKSGYGNFVENPHSYGFWATAPDIGSEVMCLFLYGKEDFGYYIGCMPQPGINHMVPAVAASSNVIMSDAEASAYGGATSLPAVETNNNSEEFNVSVNFNDLPRPVHRVVAKQMFQQGLIRDKVRGPISSSASRESPSKVFGFSTPGRPIYSGTSGENSAEQGANLYNAQHSQAKIIARQGGHSFVMDDGDNFGENNLMRLRTSAGHQITMSDDGQTLFITHANGQSYVELGKEGTVDIYSTNSFNVRTKGDINFHADNNFNLFAGKQLNIKAEEINVNSDKNTNLRVGDEFNQQTVGTHLVKSGKAMSFDAQGAASLKSAGTTFINGSRVNLNTGSTGANPKDLKPIKLATHPDTLFDSTQGWIPAPGKLISITSRAPAHQPWINSNLGVDVKVNENASASFPSAPSSDVSRSVSNIPPTSAKVTTPALTGTVPSVNGVNKNFDQNVTASLVSQTAVNAGTNSVTGNAALSGGGIVQDINGTKAAILGKLGHSPAQLEQGGYLKPGSSTLVNSLVAQGKNLNEALPKNLWTGKDSVNSVNDFKTNTNAQTGNQVELMKQGIFSLQQKNIISGNESPTQIAGLVTSTVQFGADPVVNFVKNSSTPLSATQGPVSQLVTQNIATSNYAANLADKVTNPIGSMLSAAGNTASAVVNSIKGAASGVFSAIKSGYAKLTGNTPQNLTTLNSQSAASGGNPLGSLAGGANAVTNEVSGVANKASLTAGITQLGSAIKSFIANNVIGTGGNATLQTLSNLTKSGVQQASLNGLTTSQIATIKSATNSVSSGGSQTYYMPTVAKDTNNRSEIKTSSTALTGDSRVPSAPTESSTAKPPPEVLQQQLEQSQKEREELKVKLDIARQKTADAKLVYGANSAEFEKEASEWKAIFKEFVANTDKQAKLRSEILAATYG